MKRRRGRFARGSVGWALLAGPFTAITIGLDLSPVGSGAPSWIYVVDALGWFAVVYLAVWAWRMNPRRLARRAWPTASQLYGPRRDEISADGIVRVGPDGIQVHVPWSSIDHIRETERAFHLIRGRGARPIMLLKRGLNSLDLIPALREFLNAAIAR